MKMWFRFLVAIASLVCLSVPVMAEEKPKDSSFADAEQDLLKAADQISKDVARIRGLPLKHPIKKGIKRREELRAVLIQKLAEEVSDDDITAEGNVYKRLGLIPDDMDYKSVLLDVLTEQIAGFYDQKTEELYVMAGIPLSLQRPAMAHELFHGIQDQHFNILEMQEPFSSIENGDFALARSALIEGDATIVMFDYALYEAGTLPQASATSVVDIPMVAGVLKSMSFDDMSAIEQMMGSQASAISETSVADSALAKAPAVFRELLMFPYFAGMRFVVAARIGKPWTAVDAIYANPPTSTEQILHPERYYAGDDPVIVEFDSSAALEGWNQMYESVLGEFQVGLFLKTHLGAKNDVYANAAMGWDGDRLQAFEKDGRFIVVHATIWDTWADAEEYFTAVDETVRLRYPQADPTTRTGKNGESRCYARKEAGERVYVERWGDVVLYIEGAPSELDASGVESDATMIEVRESVFSTFKRTPMAVAIEEAKARKK